MTVMLEVVQTCTSHRLKPITRIDPRNVTRFNVDRSFKPMTAQSIYTRHSHTLQRISASIDPLNQ